VTEPEPQAAPEPESFEDQDGDGDDPEATRETDALQISKPAGEPEPEQDRPAMQPVSLAATVVRPVPELPKPEPAADTSSTVKSSTRRKRFRRKGQAFVDRPGKCSVCGRRLQAKDDKALEASGWVVNDRGGLCTSCQGDGWEWAERASLPSRRHAEQH
jgi:hypothetical protein